MKWLAYTLLALAVLLLHQYAEIGSDSDNAIELGASSLLEMSSPYQKRTHLGQTLTPMLGWLFLNLPSAWLGAHLWCLVWLGIFLSRTQKPITGIVLMLLAAKSLIQGIDYVANGCAVLFFCDLLAAGVPAAAAASGAVESYRPVGYGVRVGADGSYHSGRMATRAPERVAAGGSNIGLDADRCMLAGILLLLPALWVSNQAQHALLAAPFLAAAWDRK